MLDEVRRDYWNALRTADRLGDAIALQGRPLGAAKRAGRIASLWSVLRVLIEIELMHKRTRSRPLNMHGARGWGD